jgi:K+-transporting ATPase ATPase C chain
MFRETVTALRACVVTLVLCGAIYPAVVWVGARVAFPSRAAGSLVVGRDGATVGSELIAQPFASDRYFHPRPSAVDYKADAAGGSNLGPKNPELRKKVEERAAALGATAENPAPPDMATASGSGLDPDVSPEAAKFQIRRVAAARSMPVDKLEALVASHVDSSGEILGAPPRVNVLKLNLALDELAGPAVGR